MSATFGTCRWFALCANDAIGMLPHPMLGLVPICQRCCDRVEQGDALIACERLAERPCIWCGDVVICLDGAPVGDEPCRKSANRSHHIEGTTS